MPLLSGFMPRVARRLAAEYSSQFAEVSESRGTDGRGHGIGRKRYPTPTTVSMYWSAYVQSLLRSPLMWISTVRGLVSGLSPQICAKIDARGMTSPACCTSSANSRCCIRVNLTVPPSSITT